MGWDIVFRARFATPESPSQRFGRLSEAIRRRPSFCKFSAFKVCSDAALIRPLASLGDNRTDDGPVTHESVEALLRRYSSEDEVAISGTWKVIGERDGVATIGSVTVSTLGPTLGKQHIVPADVIWGVGDSRRYTAEGKENHPNTVQVMADVPILVEVGAESIWGVDSSLTIAPRHLFAVFHRDPNAFHDDGIDPPYPDLPIDSDMMEIALGASTKHAPHERIIHTDAGPIIYHEDLGNGGDLRTFYAGLRGVLQADAEEVD